MKLLKLNKRKIDLPAKNQKERGKRKKSDEKTDFVFIK